MIWTVEKIREARRYLQEYKTYGATSQELSKIFGEVVTYDSLRNALRRQESRQRTKEKVNNAFAPPIHLIEDKIAIASDFHAPYHSPEMMQHLLHVSKEMNVRTLCIIGDLFNFDSVSTFSLYGDGQSLTDEFKEAGRVLEDLGSWYTSIYIVNGNHEERFSKRLQADIKLRSIVDISLSKADVKSQVYVSEYDYMLLTSNGQEWIAGHPSTCTKQPGEIARQIAEQHKKNVAVGHDHIVGFRSTEDGMYMGVSIGSMIALHDTKSALWYKQRRLNTYKPFKNGFMILNGGIPYLFTQEGSSCLNGGMSWDFWYN